MKIVVFSAMFGRSTDQLRPPTVLGHDVIYRCYTDNPRIRVPGWELVVLPSEGDPVLQARRTKILSHLTEPAADVTIWIDAAFQLQIDPVPLLHVNRHIDLLALRHPDRDTVKAEGQELVRLGMVPAEKIRQQLAGMNPLFLGSQDRLTATGLLIRWHRPLVREFNRQWMEGLLSGGHTRDQMSFDYAQWLTGAPLKYLDGNYRDNPYATWSAQRGRR